MNIFKNFDWSFRSIFKLIGVAILGVMALSTIIYVVGLALSTIQGNNTVFKTGDSRSTAQNYAYDEGGYPEVASSMGIAPSYFPVPEPSSPAGENLEDFEVKTYNADLSTRHLESDCQKIVDLKLREEVIFENSDQDQDACTFRFKVKKENADEILTLIQSMNPRHFSTSIQTIKGSLDYNNNELDIFTKNLEETQAALQSALEAYDQVTNLATGQGDAETLASILNNKLTLIQQLTDKRLELENAIQRYEQSKADQLDRLNYDFFNINVYKDLIFDWQEIKDNWNFEAKELIRYLNMALQGMTVSLLAYLFIAVQWILYFFLAVFVAKGIWMATRRIWKLGEKKN